MTRRNIKRSYWNRRKKI